MSAYLQPLNLNPCMVVRIITCREAADQDDRINFRILRAIKPGRSASTGATGNDVNVSNLVRVA